MNLRKILSGVKILNDFREFDTEISDISYNSKSVRNGTLFVCLVGKSSDGHKFAFDAIQKGASAIVCEKDLNLKNQIIVENSRKALSKISSNFFDGPSKKLKLIAVTGTKGKTTVSSFISKILNNSGIKTSQIGTLGAIFGKKIIDIKNTTPESLEIQKLLRKSLDLGFKYVVVEASSIGLKNHRLDNIDIDFGIFTNLSKDHIGPNEHETFDDYLESKSLLFKKCKTGFINIDDPFYKRIISGHTCYIQTYGFSNNANTFCSKYEFCKSKFGSSFIVNNKEFRLSIPGKYNIYNALSSIAICTKIGVKYETIKNSLADCKINGRCEIVANNDLFTIIIDYAHNAFGLESAINSLREYHPKRLVTLIGAGGDRSKERRAPMGKVSGNLSDLTVITSDNPRSENPFDIINDIKKGILETSGKFVVIPDRRAAIEYCVDNCQKGDLILLAGKGHETYQEINGILHDFDEKKIVNDILSARGII